jgi:hypothetical protein
VEIYKNTFNTMSGRGRGGRGLGKRGGSRNPVDNYEKFDEDHYDGYQIVDNTDPAANKDNKPLYLVKRVTTKAGKTSHRVYKATYVKRGKSMGYKITVGGKRVPVKTGSKAFTRRYDALRYAAAKRSCKYGIHKVNGSCRTKRGRASYDQAKAYHASKGLNLEQYQKENMAQFKFGDKKKRPNFHGSEKMHDGERHTIGYVQGTVRRKSTTKRKPSAYNKYMKKNLGSLKNMTTAERKKKFSTTARGWKKLSTEQQNKYK